MAGNVFEARVIALQIADRRTAASWLREHRRVQRELKFANRTTYADHGLVFAKTFAELTGKPKDVLGLPLVAEHLGAPFARLIKKAGV